MSIQKSIKVLPGELSLDWRLLSAELFAGLRCCASVRSAEPRCWQADIGRQLPTNLPSVRRVLSQLANDHCFCSPKAVEQSSGWHYIMLNLWQWFGENWKHIYFGIRTESMFVDVLAIVVLVVIYLGHLKM